MQPSVYIKQTIDALLEQDEEIKAIFYAHIYDIDPLFLETLHQKHHKIKKWVEKLRIIYDEMVANEETAYSNTSAKQTVFQIKRYDMADIASGVRTDSGFRVRSGSFISPIVASNMYDVVKKLRREYEQYIDAQNYLLVDIDFDNPGQAARFVIGKQVNGIEEWKTDKGVSLKSYESNIAKEV